ncbi:MAG: sigma-70 family RNA polymerase sigma factor [Tepidiformaceae bacterium]
MNLEPDEQRLVSLSQRADRQAFGQLVTRHQEAAFRAAYLIVRERGAAEEIAQEAFLRAHAGLGRFREGEPFRPWLLRIVTNLALNEVRARSRRNGLLERLGWATARSAPAADRVVLVDEEQRELWDAVNELGPEDRVVLYLRYFLELPEREMAVAIGKAPGTVKSRLSRASARLRTVIESRYPSLYAGAQTPGGEDE